MKFNLVAKILEENIKKEAKKWTTQKETKRHKKCERSKEQEEEARISRKIFFSDERNFMWKGEQEDSAKNSTERESTK